MIGIAVDSNSQLPDSLAERFGIEVVPLTVTLDGVEYREGIDLTAAEFYSAFAEGRKPEVATSQPSPGQFIEAYQRLISAGATEILSVHITETMSGTLNSARLAEGSVPARVRLVDTGTASFGVSCCAWAAAEAIAAGADLDTAATIAEQRAAQLATVFIVGVPELAARSGRADGVDEAAREGIPVLTMTGGKLDVLTSVATIDDAVAAMRDFALAWPPSDEGGLRVAIGTSDESSRPVSAALTDAMRGSDLVADIVQYSIGPSVGAHTGPGTAGLFVF